MPRTSQKPSKGYVKSPQDGADVFDDYDEEAAAALSTQEALEVLSLQGHSRRLVSDEQFGFE